LAFIQRGALVWSVDPQTLETSKSFRLEDPGRAVVVRIPKRKGPDFQFPGCVVVRTRNLPRLLALDLGAARIDY
jgi:hypothetical protein